MEKSKNRKAHKKSRNGCTPCKSRHVKCDETKPRCVNCINQGTPCEYRSSKSKTGLAGSLSLSVSRENKEPQRALPTASEPYETTLNIRQLRLIHHYSSTTGPSLGADSDSGEIWASAVVRTAFDHPYLLHIVLALAALHISRLEFSTFSGSPTNSTQELPGTEAMEHLTIAEKHHEAALGSFQATVRDIDESNYQAVIMFAALLFPYSCAISISGEHDVEYEMDRLLFNFTLTRKMRPMVANFYQAIKASDMGKTIPKDVESTDWNTQEPPTETELMQLRRFSEAARHLYPQDIVEAYSHAIHVLELVFAASAKSGSPASDALLKIWIHLVTERYVELLSERQPGSLIIYAHFAVLLRRSSVQFWYLEGVAEQILNIADSLVPYEWRAWLDWPKEQIRGAQVFASC